MKNKIYLLLLLMVLAACRSDYLQDAEQRNDLINNGLITKIISLNQSKHKARLLWELSESKQMLSKHPLKNTLGKAVNFGDSISIDTDRVIYIENGPNYHTYTFNIQRSNPQPSDPVENLLLSPLPDGSYKEFLVTYDLTDQEKTKLRNGVPVSMEGKTTTTELAAGTYNGNGQLARVVCGWQNQLGVVNCSEGVHHSGNLEDWVNCTATTPPSVYIITYHSCWEEQDDTLMPIDPGGSGSGGGEPCTDCPPTNPTDPTDCVVVPTDPQNPSTGFTDENGCAIGTPTLPNLPHPRNTCEKTKALFQRPEVLEKIQDLKNHTGPNEKGWKFMKDGTPPQEAPPAPNNNYSIYVGDTSLLEGFHHTHPETGMFSPTDIGNMIIIAKSITAGSSLSINDAWAGMIGPGGSHYIVRFTGSFSDLQGINFTEPQLKVWLGKQLSEAVNYTQNKPIYQETVNGKTLLNNKGREALFFATIKMMNLENRVSLLEIDQNGNVSTIKQNQDGSTNSIPCL